MKALFIILITLLFTAGYALTGQGDSGSITLDTVNPTLQLQDPASSAEWYIGLEYNVTWTAADNHFSAQPIQVNLSRDEGANYLPVSGDIANSGLYTLTASAPETSSGKLQLVATDSFGNYTEVTNSGIITIDSYHPPVISNVTAVQRTDGSKTVDIYFDLADANNDNCDISVMLSDNDGVSYELPMSYLSGDWGQGVAPGTGKHIVWYAEGTAFELSRVFDGNTFRIRVLADDSNGSRK